MAYNGIATRTTTPRRCPKVPRRDWRKRIAVAHLQSYDAVAVKRIGLDLLARGRPAEPTRWPPMLHMFHMLHTKI
jgi:hypothetical protein